MTLTLKYHHLGMPTTTPVAGETHIPHLRIFATDHESNPYGIQWMRYEADCPVPEIVRRLPHVAFEVNDLDLALQGKKVIIPPNSPSPGVQVALIEEEGLPVEFLYFLPKED